MGGETDSGAGSGGEKQPVALGMLGDPSDATSPRGCLYFAWCGADDAQTEVRQQASRALMRDMLDAGVKLVGVVRTSGPQDMVRAASRLVAQREGLVPRLSMHMRLFKVVDLVEGPKGPGDGVLRKLTDSPSDLSLAQPWAKEFLVETFPTITLPDEAMDGIAREILGRGLYVWEDGGSPVAMAAISGKSPRARRLGMVYTPPDSRGRGYGTNVTYSLSKYCQDDLGCEFVCLLTDLENPVSNFIYQVRAMGQQ